jgi:hypothetical protein
MRRTMNRALHRRQREARRHPIKDREAIHLKIKRLPLINALIEIDLVCVLCSQLVQACPEFFDSVLNLRCIGAAIAKDQSASRLFS